MQKSLASIRVKHLARAAIIAAAHDNVKGRTWNGFRAHYDEVSK